MKFITFPNKETGHAYCWAKGQNPREMIERIKPVAEFEALILNAPFDHPEGEDHLALSRDQAIERATAARPDLVEAWNAFHIQLDSRSSDFDGCPLETYLPESVYERYSGGDVQPIVLAWEVGSLMVNDINDSMEIYDRFGWETPESGYEMQTVESLIGPAIFDFLNAIDFQAIARALLAEYGTKPAAEPAAAVAAE